MLYNRCTGIYKFGNNTHPWHIRHRSNLGNIFLGKKSASYGPGNTVVMLPLSNLPGTLTNRTLESWGGQQTACCE